MTLDHPPLPVAGATEYMHDDISHTAWTPKLDSTCAWDGPRSPTYPPRAGSRAAASTSRHRRPGAGMPEWAWSYEGGVKASLANGRARTSVAVFHTDYTDLQVMSTFRPGVIDISNAAAATISGLELEAEMQLGPSLHGGGHVAWLDATYDQYLAVGAGGVTADVAGHQRRTRLNGLGVSGSNGPTCAVAPAFCRCAAIPGGEHSLLYAVQRRHPAPASAWSSELSAELRDRGRGLSIGAYART